MLSFKSSPHFLQLLWYVCVGGGGGDVVVLKFGINFCSAYTPVGMWHDSVSVIFVLVALYPFSDIYRAYHFCLVSMTLFPKV